MARIAFILLCHKDPEAIARQAEQLTAAGDFIAIHFDASARAADYALLRERLGGNPSVAFARRRLRCGWGEWSLVDATLSALDTALEAFPRASHFYLVSGDCMAIKSAEYAHAYLDARDRDFIETQDFFESGWIKTGMREDRLVYRHFFNERTQSWLFYRSYELQQRLKLRREIPADLQMRIGSQWWCLRRQTVEALMEFTRSRRDVMRFFRTTWIPDETFFQTLVWHLVPAVQIENRTPTFLMFTDYGLPVTFHDDHFEMLLGQDALFARKVSPEAQVLRERLGALYAGGRIDFPLSNEGRRLFHFLTQRGRIGRRFAPRVWETGATLGRERQLFVLICKKWHVAKRLAEAIRRHTDIPALDYVFNEIDGPMPDLGGIGDTMEKRARHRRAFLRLVFDELDTDRLAICLDPSDIDIVTDLYSDHSATRICEIRVNLDDPYLVGHARRIGLAGEGTAEETIARLLPTIRADMIHERERLRDIDLKDHHVLRQDASDEANARVLSRFLPVDEETALTLARTPHLFVD